MANLSTGVFVDATEYNADTFDIGDVKWSARRLASTNWLRCDGSAISRATYAALFAAIIPSLGTFTVTLASPGVFTLTAHGLVIGDRVYLTTTGALPTGLSANTIYYVVSVPTADTFTLSASEGGSAINTSGSQSGVHSLHHCPWGLGDGSTTFNLPDPLGRSLVAGAGASGNAKVRAAGQNEAVALANRKGPIHRHTAHSHTSLVDGNNAGAATGVGGFLNDRTAFTGASTSSVDGGSGNSNDPLDGGAYLVMPCYIKYA